MKQLKTTILLFCLCLVAIAQNDSLVKQKNTYVYNKYTLFAFYDVVRFAGVGAEYKSPSFFAVEVKLGGVYANSPVSKIPQKLGLTNNDYSYNKGVGIMLTPKQYFGKRKYFYFGLYGAVYLYGYKDKFFENTSFIANVRTYKSPLSGMIGISGGSGVLSKTSESYAFGFTVGFSNSIKRINYEIFVAAGIERAQNQYSMFLAQPSTGTPNFSTGDEASNKFNALVGIKIGLGYMQQQLIDYRYYVSLFKSLIKEEDKFVKEFDAPDYHYKDLKEEYYKYRYKLKEELIKDCQSAKTDTVLMQQHTIKAAKKIKEFVNDNFKENP